MSHFSALRQQLRAKRQALSLHAQRQHALEIARQLGKLPWVLRARRIGGYEPADGEVDPSPLIAQLQTRHRRYYLPVLRTYPRGKLWFVLHQSEACLSPNRYGIPEPPLRDPQMPWALDLLLLPLVGFDAQCHRLGMGGGYYDRTLSHLRRLSHWKRPRLIGIAHECQRVAQLPVQPWDIPLDLVVTEAGIYRRKSF